MRAINLFFAITFFCVGNAYAQNTTTTITYSKVGGSEDQDHEFYNAIKIDPLAIFVGEIPIYYERRFGKYVGLEFLLGITHNDYAFDVFNFGYIDETGDRRAGFGYTTGIGGKFYISRDGYALDGVFFGLEARYKHYLTHLTNTCSSTSNTDEFKETRNVLDGKIIGGYIWNFDSGLLIEAYGGVGIRSINVNGYTCDRNGPISTFAPTQFRRERLVLSLGVKIGFLF